MIGYLFPGQGTVRVGMGGWLRRDPAGARVFAAADDVHADLDGGLAELCARGPLERLISTDVAQPVVTACNLAALEVLRSRGHVPDIVAGHSVGELSALCAAGVLDVEATLRLVAVRSRLMAALPDVGGMTAVLGLTEQRVAELAAEASAPGEPAVVGLVNGPDNIVVSGALPALQRVADLAVDARKVVSLKVGGAFHSPLMAGAVDDWAAAVRATPMRPPAVPVVPNVTAEPTTDLAEITDALIAQLTGRVRWAETVLRLTDVDTCVEVGDSKVLTGLHRGVGGRCLTMADPTAVRRLRAESVA
ncbi:[acyl-carrier-protein] S-malonyltransferase [Saccharothrix ecbatanensis]|jgi:[acyl-carrier-protein] S-malonyltransferase|uniref:Malonyl CoA-acyl carrier protein transacylase n=1 Tax=Saccharothrix ecbatanensis TaxID=1105145 RepID=A0A7W9M063_9PSEU|nr:ACP S-malonyltransferase [Saccharothrix ecbatanensis]MBB5802526.1 [acyl-carrier-protein] S-malonyltransferase [Saccharothrix ecbatanensis]